MAEHTKKQQISDFAVAFAQQYREYAKAHKIKQRQIANILGRTQPYVSKGMNGLRALDLDDVDALAQLTGTSGKTLLIELTRLTHQQLSHRETETNRRIDDAPYTLAAYEDESKRAESETPEE